MTKHYVAMAGLHGCMPQYCSGHEHYNDAVDDLIGLHEIEDSGEALVLERDSSIELDIHEHGNEYAEITECDCDDINVHNDN